MFYSSQRWNWTWSRNHSPNSLEPGLTWPELCLKFRLLAYTSLCPQAFTHCWVYTIRESKSHQVGFCGPLRFLPRRYSAKTLEVVVFVASFARPKYEHQILVATNSSFHFPLYQLFAVITSRVFVGWFFNANVFKPGSTKAASGLQLLTEKCVQHKTVSMQRYLHGSKEAKTKLLQC